MVSPWTTIRFQLTDADDTELCLQLGAVLQGGARQNAVTSGEFLDRILEIELNVVLFE